MTTTGPPKRSNKGFIAIVAVIALLGFGVIAVLATRGGDDAAPVAAAGEAFAPMPANTQITDATNDPSAGKVAPTITLSDFSGNEVTIEADGRPKVVLFLAHWCPHCQEEVPVVQGLIDDGRLSDAVDLYAISTAVDASRGNYPPEAWLEEEGLQAAILQDDADNSAFENYGGSGFPYAVYLDGEGRIVARTAGNVPAETLVQLWDQTAAS